MQRAVQWFSGAVTSAAYLYVIAHGYCGSALPKLGRCIYICGWPAPSQYLLVQESSRIYGLPSHVARSVQYTGLLVDCGIAIVASAAVISCVTTCGRALHARCAVSLSGVLSIIAGVAVICAVMTSDLYRPGALKELHWFEHAGQRFLLIDDLLRFPPDEQPALGYFPLPIRSVVLVSVGCLGYMIARYLIDKLGGWLPARQNARDTPISRAIH